MKIWGTARYSKPTVCAPLFKVMTAIEGFSTLELEKALKGFYVRSLAIYDDLVLQY